ncbi:hypothetical protein [Flavimaricola marinus]|uniref:Uncharacterized protein n=1 Tax=Flavimaricola marinus TaxID=1819565 RepID=A0A238LCE5_9RHOB|nr:hypothetical protein [Flavimaricola marinus]SMY07291.1 hypothetical protein LOM8899_01424 [Flavimaricola marinus]
MANEHSDQTISELSTLLKVQGLSARDRNAGERLLQRLTSPVYIAILGPDRRTASAITSNFDSICKFGLDLAKVRIGDDMSVADIALWCTRSFEESELREWESAPISLKDHSFLVASAPSPERLAALSDISAEEFLGFHVVSDDRMSGPINDLMRDIAQLTRSGLQAASDSAQLFLHKNAQKQADQRGTAKLEPTPTTQPTMESGVSRSDKLAFETALQHLDEHASELLRLSEHNSDSIIDDVLKLCSRASEDLADVISTASSEHPDHDAICDAAYAAVDHITLMSLENDMNAATDAVTVLLQLRNDLSVRVAA